MDTKKLRQKILDLAIHGKLVPQDPNDEPASVLLERIKAEKEQLIKEGKIKRQKKSASSDTSHYGNDVPFEVPEGWVWCNITEITYKITDGTHHSPISYPRGDYMYVTAKNIKESGVSLDNMTFVTSEVFRDVFSRCNPELGDILYIKDGATTGVVTINDIKDPFCLLSSVALIKPSKSIDRKYLLYYLRSSTCYSSVRESMKGVGITRVTLKQIENWVVPIPPLSEQKRIVDEVEKWFVQIDAIEQDSSDLKDAVQKAKSKILDLALSGRLTSDTSHYPQLPEGWEEVRLGDISRLISGTSYSKNDIRADGIRILRGGNIQYGKTLLLDNDVYISTSLRNKECSLVRGDIVIVASTGSLDLIGKAGYIEQDIPDAQIGAFLRIVRPIDSSVSQYLRLIFESNLYKSHIQDLAKGTNINNIKASYITDFFIPLPPICEQKAICSMVKVIFQQLDDIESSIVK